MYNPPSFREDSREVLHAFIHTHSFATLVTHAGGAPTATHLPLFFEPDAGEQGTLVGHMARANLQWRDLAGGQEALAMFQGPHAYVSPSWYITHPSVPTWNYTAVHAYGRAELVEEPQELRAILAATVTTYEGGRAEPWRFELPDDYVNALVRQIVGFRIAVTRLEGKFKLSQNRPLADRQGVVEALRAQGDGESRAVADLMAARLPPQSDDGELLRIRPYEAADEAAVVELWRACGLTVPWNDPYRDIATKRRAQPELFLVAILGGEVIGTVMVGYDGHRGWINYLGVAPEHQRQGIGRRLMERAEAELRRRGCPKINLQVRAANQGVIAFYERVGFTLEDVRNLGKRLQ
jgi:transcriptional regulator